MEYLFGLFSLLAFDEFDSVALLSLLHHDLSRFGGDSREISGSKLLEFALLRGNVRQLSFSNLRNELERVHGSLDDNIHTRAKLRDFYPRRLAIRF